MVFGFIPDFLDAFLCFCGFSGGVSCFCVAFWFQKFKKGEGLTGEFVCGFVDSFLMGYGYVVIFCEVSQGLV